MAENIPIFLKSCTDLHVFLFCVLSAGMELSPSILFSIFFGFVSVSKIIGTELSSVLACSLFLLSTFAHIRADLGIVLDVKLSPKEVISFFNYSVDSCPMAQHAYCAVWLFL